ncbi:MAG: hypothetical protein D8M59_08235 [Planctomycetes bacterium]|nr:hypothetical protein [Planctomycetota bacterium]
MCTIVTAVSAAPDRPPVEASALTATHVKPKRLARIGRDLQLLSPWIEVGNGSSGPASCPPSSLAFDCFEPDGGMPGMPTDGLYGQDCGMGSQRWYFGSTYCNTYFVNDMTTTPDLQSAQSERAEWAWWWYVNGPGSSEQCYVALWTAEWFDEDCIGPAAEDYYEGIIFDFGILPNSEGYYYSDTQDLLCGSGLAWELPADGDGAYTMILANDYNGTTLFMATCAQPMLWGTKALNPSHQGPVQWDDDNPADGTHTAPDECYDYTHGTCPDPLGAMTCFYGEPRYDEPCLELDIDQLFVGQNTTFTVSQAEPNQELAILYSLRSGRFQFQGFDWCLDLGLQYTSLGQAQQSIIRQGRADSNGTMVAAVPIPTAARGLLIYFQATARGTCPLTCESPVVFAKGKDEVECDPVIAAKFYSDKKRCGSTGKVLHVAWVCNGDECTGKSLVIEGTTGGEKDTQTIKLKRGKGSGTHKGKICWDIGKTVDVTLTCVDKDGVEHTDTWSATVPKK